MKTNKIRVTESNSDCFTKGKEYDVIRWERFSPVCKDDYGDVVTMCDSKWEPVQEFKHGDPVWAWDNDENDKSKGLYIGKDSFHHGYYVEVSQRYAVFYKNVEHRKKQITIEELAERADIDLNKYEIVE